jgi:hypothetical protein
MNETNQDLIASMATLNGQHMVMKKVVEECLELIRAISRGEVKNIVEELVDVEITVLQLLWSLPEGSRTRRAEIFSEKIEYIEGLIVGHKIAAHNKVKETIRMPVLNHEHGDDAEVNG